MTPDPISQLADALAPRYEVQRELGRGGMATVFLARDVRHDRLVAVKVLDPELAASVGAERFLAEIRLTAQLHHPNILALFDSGEANGLLYYVMPYIAGETLRARLERERQLPVADAVRIATAVASALEHAHKAGVVHRDLKPENILMQDGEPIVADFGIALAVRRAVGERLTMTGMSLGTPAYMSPEQATGDRIIDARADIFSLGCVTYEMLAGETPFAAPTAQGTIARIVTDQPRNLTLVRPTVPASVAAAIARSLEKLPADRWTTAHDFSVALNTLGATSTLPTTGGVTPPGEHTRWLPWAVAAVASLAAMAALAALAPRKAAQPNGDGPTIRFLLAAPDSQRPLIVATSGIPLAMSGDERHIAYIGAGGSGTARVYERALGEISPRAVVGSDGDPGQPTFSQDGKWLAFTLDEKIIKTPVDGGPLTTVMPIPNAATAGFDWFAPDTIMASLNGAIVLVPASGGTSVKLIAPDAALGQTAFWGPHVVSRDLVALVSVSREGIAGNRIAVYNRQSKRLIVSAHHGTTVLGAIGDRAIWVTAAGVAMAAPLASDGTLGDARAVLEGVLVRAGGAAKAALGSNSLIYERGAALGRLAVVSQDGKVDLIDAPPGGYEHPRWSPDGSRLAIAIAKGGRTDIWIMNGATRTFSRLTSDGFSDSPDWTPDGMHVAYRRVGSDSTVIAIQRADGGDAPTTLVKAKQAPYAVRFSPNPRWFLYRTADFGKAPGQIVAVDRDRGDAVTTLSSLTSFDMAPEFSPDGKWLTNISPSTGRAEVYVRSFPDNASQFVVSTNGGSEPRWSKDGRTLYYRLGRAMWAAAISFTPSFTVTSRRKLFEGPFLSDPANLNYDLMPDGKSFLMIQPVESQSETTVIWGWGNELLKLWRQ